jgi:hypothetical protein
LIRSKVSTFTLIGRPPWAFLELLSIGCKPA